MNLTSEKYRKNHEYLNIASHFAGFILSIIGFFYLINLSDTLTKKWSVAIYGISLSLVFLSSTTYHIFSLQQQTAKQKLARIWDHIMIFFLIAGSYTPFIMLKFESEASTFLLVFLWVLVFVGTFLKLFFLEKTQTLALIIYIAMGLLSLFFLDEMIKNLSAATFENIKIGGICYLIGVVFYKIKKIPYNHFIWHLLVMAGSFFLFMAVANVVK